MGPTSETDLHFLEKGQHENNNRKYGISIQYAFDEIVRASVHLAGVLPQDLVKFRSHEIRV